MLTTNFKPLRLLCSAALLGLLGMPALAQSLPTEEPQTGELSVVELSSTDKPSTETTFAPNDDSSVTKSTENPQETGPATATETSRISMAAKSVFPARWVLGLPLPLNYL